MFNIKKNLLLKYERTDTFTNQPSKFDEMAGTTLKTIEFK